MQCEYTLCRIYKLALKSSNICVNSFQIPNGRYFLLWGVLIRLIPNSMQLLCLTLRFWEAKNPDSWDFMILWVNVAIADIRAHLHIWNDVGKNKSPLFDIKHTLPVEAIWATAGFFNSDFVEHVWPGNSENPTRKGSTEYCWSNTVLLRLAFLWFVT